MSLRNSESHSSVADCLANEADKLLACVHCGLCLEACPTYIHTGDENDSPRGRIYLMRAVEEKRIEPTSPTFIRHINRCLGCRACEAACPAGVPYGQLLEAARAEIETTKTRKTFSSVLLHFMLRQVWLHPSRLRFAFSLARLARDTKLTGLLLKTSLTRFVSKRMEFALALLESSKAATLSESSTKTATDVVRKEAAHAGKLYDVKFDDETNASQYPATSVLLFTGCVTEGLFTRINAATRRVLAANGYAVRAPQSQVCCGALHAHAGDLEGARILARRNIEAFAADMTKEDADARAIITNAGGCGAMLVSYEHLLANDPQYAEQARRFSQRVRDIGQQLETTKGRQGASLHGCSATYDSSCHLLYGQHASEASLALMRAIPELKFLPLEESDVCCGGAGLYNLLQTELSARVLAEKLAHIEATRAQILATGNPGCHMQIGAGARLNGMETLRVCHPVELLDESYRRAGFYEPEKKVKGKG